MSPNIAALNLIIAAAGLLSAFSTSVARISSFRRLRCSLLLRMPCDMASAAPRTARGR